MAIHMATRSGREEMLTYLIDQGAELDAVTRMVN